MTTLHHYSAVVKIGAWILGSMVVVLGAIVTEMEKGMSPAIWVALIMGFSSLLVAITTGLFSLRIQARIEHKVDGVLSKAHQDEKTASTRADRAESFREGSESEREKGKP